MGQQAEKKDQTERVTGLGRSTREEIVKWNQMTALKFQTRGRHQASQSPFGGTGRTGQQNFSLRHKATKFLKKNAFEKWQNTNNEIHINLTHHSCYPACRPP